MQSLSERLLYFCSVSCPLIDFGVMAVLWVCSVRAFCEEEWNAPLAVIGFHLLCVSAFIFFFVSTRFARCFVLDRGRGWVFYRLRGGEEGEGRDGGVGGGGPRRRGCGGKNARHEDELGA